VVVIALLFFVLGIGIGWASYPARQVHWRYGPIEWTRVGYVAVFRIGKLRIAKVGNSFRRIRS
jgi:hypothetical protein